MTETTEVEIGTERESDLPGDWADVYAYVDDGEHARVWCVKREGDFEIAVTAFHCEAGLHERDGEFGKKYFEVDAGTSTRMWAEDYAKNHQGAIQITRDYWA
jgi:hypothetical protein